MVKHEHDEDLWLMILKQLVEECRSTNKGMRFGQMLYNAVTMYDRGLGRYYSDAEFHVRLFTMYDEELSTALTEWFAYVEEQRSKM